mgnify:CR=1 FL=1
MQIPSMGGTSLGPMLQKWALDAETIVELGTWLGAGTKQLASTCPGIVHTYDIFKIHGNEIDKAAAYGVTVTEGQDSLPLVKKMLSEFKNIRYYKGRICDHEWLGIPIDLYVDDACKYEPEFIGAIKKFSPYWIAGKTICVFMDYWWYLSRPNDERAKFQKNYISNKPESFEHIISDKHLGCAAFLYKGGLCV